MKGLHKIRQKWNDSKLGRNDISVRIYLSFVVVLAVSLYLQARLSAAGTPPDLSFSDSIRPRPQLRTRVQTRSAVLGSGLVLRRAFLLHLFRQT